MAIIVILSLFITFFMHVCLVRVCGLFKHPFSRQGGVFVSFLFGFMFLGIIFFFWIAGLRIRIWPGILCSGIYLFSIYTLSAYVYFHLFNMSETARRVRILTQSYAGQIEKGELSNNYTCHDMVSNRLRRLVGLGELQLTEGRYLLGRRTLLLPAKVVFAFRGIIFPKGNSLIKG